MAGTGGTEPLSEDAGLAQDSQEAGWPLGKSHLCPFNLPAPLSHSVLELCCTRKAFKHQGEPEIPRVSQTASLIQARPSDCTCAKTQTRLQLFVSCFVVLIWTSELRVMCS